jgi:very-short-patch-repair endonuclease
VVTRGDLLGLGFSKKAIEHRVENGRLHPIRRGVYAVGRRELTREGWWMAAVLACGPDAVLSGASAAALWGIGREPAGAVEVSVRRGTAPRVDEVRTRRRPALPDEDVTIYCGIPVTTPARTLLDLAAAVAPARLERAVNEADKLDLIDPETLRRWLESRRREPGATALRRLLDRATFRLSDSELERLFRPLALAAGLPQPQTKQRLNGFEVDFAWPGLGLVVETDGLRYHRTPASQERDLRRDQAHVSSGLTTLRFSHHQVKFEADRVRSVLAATAARLSG